MKDAKPVSMPLANHFKFNERSRLTKDEEKGRMVFVSYSSAVESVIYAMVYTQQGIDLAVCLVSRFISNPMKKH